MNFGLNKVLRNVVNAKIKKEDMLCNKQDRDAEAI